MPNEVGYCVCRKGQLLIRMKDVEGEAYSMTIPVGCSEGKPAAVVHTHPSGNIEPSELDKKAGKELGIPVCVVVRASDGRKVRCYKVT